MPGPVSDSYDPEFGTAERAEAIREAIEAMHTEIGAIIGKPPDHILDVVRRSDGGARISAGLTERQWRILRFACGRAAESL